MGRVTAKSRRQNRHPMNDVHPRLRMGAIRLIGPTGIYISVANVGLCCRRSIYYCFNTYTYIYTRFIIYIYIYVLVFVALLAWCIVWASCAVCRFSCLHLFLDFGFWRILYAKTMCPLKPFSFHSSIDPASLGRVESFIRATDNSQWWVYMWWNIVNATVSTRWCFSEL